MDGVKKNRKRKKQQKGNNKVMPDPIPSEALTSHPASIAEESDDELGYDAIDFTTREECVTRGEVARLAIEILGRRMNVADDKFKTMNSITSLECRLMEALSTI